MQRRPEPRPEKVDLFDRIPDPIMANISKACLMATAFLVWKFAVIPQLAKYPNIMEWASIVAILYITHKLIDKFDKS